MNREEYFKYHDELLKKMGEITRAKNADYTGAAGDDPFANFSRVDSLGVCSTEQGFLVRMLDKYMRISSFVAQGTLQVKDESVEDTLLDLANYALLFIGYLKSKKNPKFEAFKKELMSMENHYFSNGKRKLITCSACGYTKGYYRQEIKDITENSGSVLCARCSYQILTGLKYSG